MAIDVICTWAAHELNANLLVECADLVFPLIFFNERRLIAWIDSDICKVALFAWFKRQAVAGTVFTGAALTDTSVVAITGMSSASFMQTTTLGVWLVLVPLTLACAALVAMLIFSYSACYLCKTDATRARAWIACDARLVGRRAALVVKVHALRSKEDFIDINKTPDVFGDAVSVGASYEDAQSPYRWLASWAIEQLLLVLAAVVRV